MMKKKSFTDLTSPNSFWSWWPEITFCVGGLITFMIIVVVLFLYDQEKQPEWVLGITLNAVLALLSTISKASFMIALAEVMSQWKWNMYGNGKSRVIHDFALVDLASRGFWGSWLLLGRFKWRHPISIAGAISILSVITSPITQQTIDYPTRSAGIYGRSSVGVSRHWADDSEKGAVTPMISSLVEGLYSVVSPKPLDAVCPTASCSFEPFESLAMCAKVADVSDLLTISTTPPEDRPPLNVSSYEMPYNVGDDDLPSTVYYASLPNKFSFDANFPYAFYMQAANSSLAFRDDDAFPSSLLHMFIIATKSDIDEIRGLDVTEASFPTPEFHAFEILMYMCVNRYETQVEEGESRTVVKSSASIPTANKAGNVTEIPKIQCDYAPWYSQVVVDCYHDDVYGNMSLASGGNGDSNDSFSFDARGIFTASYQLVNDLRCMMMAFRRADGNMDHLAMNKATHWLREALYGPGRKITDPKEKLSRLNDYYGGIATSMSNSIRSSTTSDKFLGTAWEPEVYVNVRWGWLSFLAAELVLSTAFVILTTIATHRSQVPILKSSVIAALLAPDAEVQRILGSADELEQAIKTAKRTHVSFNNRNLLMVSASPEDTDLHTSMSEERGDA